MTVSNNNALAAKNNGKFSTFMKDNFIPTYVKAFMDCRSAKKEVQDQYGKDAVITGMVTEKANKKRGNAITLWSAKFVIAEALFQFSAKYYTLNTRDYKLTFSNPGGWAGVSPVAQSIAKSAVSLVPAHKQDYYANCAVIGEVITSGVRIYVEQKVWQKYGITPDIAGMFLTPMAAGVLEMAYKPMQTYDKDPATRLAAAVLGIYGNFVRMAHAGVMYAAGGLIQKMKGLNSEEIPRF